MRLVRSLLIVPFLVACGGEEKSDSAAAFRAAIPDRSQLEAPVADSAAAGRAIGDVATYPGQALPLAVGINGVVGSLIGVLEYVTSLPPTQVDDTRAVWGPFDDDNGVGKVAVWIAEAEEGDDFDYHYAFLRGMSDDLSTMTPVIIGGASPDPDNADRGTGIVLFDFEAIYEFEQANDPNFAQKDYTRGRFSAVFGRGEDEQNPGHELAMVVAIFRNFVSEDDPTAEPADLDYLYGEYIAPDWRADFMNYRLPVDVDADSDSSGTREDVEVQLALVNGGFGRADVFASGGSLGGETVEGIECWDTSVRRTFLEMAYSGDGGVLYAEGTEAGCSAPFNQALADTDIPSLADIAPEDYAALEGIAQNGLN